METKLIKVLEHYHLYDGDKAIATTIVGNPMLLPNLSLKNCQVIELGYDLDELAEEGVKFHEQDEIHRPNSENLYKKGFQKALELMEHRLSKETEWQVEIVMDICGDKVYAVPEPALDEQGCLILKRIDN